MCRAGIAFYDKVKQKNLALRELSGENIYEENGDQPSAFLQLKLITLTDSKRQQYLQLRLNEYLAEQNGKTETIENEENIATESQ